MSIQIQDGARVPWMILSNHPF